MFFPILTCTSAVWHVVRIVTREAATNEVTEDLIVGRRLLPTEVEGEFTNYVDLTAEFSEPRELRRGAGYINLPILDGAAPTPEALQSAVDRLQPGRTFIHCAQGHGRTGLFALAVLIARGAVASSQEGLHMLKSVRPAISLNSRQLECIRRYSELLSQSSVRQPDDQIGK